jgi:uncharacterized protein with HEPN domain
MRNVLIHIYFGIDQDVIWEMVEHDQVLNSSPVLSTIARRILA